MKPLQPYTHGILDYVIGFLLVVSPWLFQFNDDSLVATNFMVYLGIIVLALSLLTRYPLGLLKLVPFKVHGFIETVGAIALVASPWLFGFNTVASATYFAVIVGILYIGVIAMTNYQEYGYSDNFPRSR